MILPSNFITAPPPFYGSVLSKLVPFIGVFKKGKSLPQNVDDLFFKEGAPLQDEYNNLYRALFNKPEQYIRETLIN